MGKNQERQKLVRFLAAEAQACGVEVEIKKPPSSVMKVRANPYMTIFGNMHKNQKTALGKFSCSS